MNGAGGVIVETEAYDHTDPASHSVRGKTARKRRHVRTARHCLQSTAPTACTGAFNLVCGTQPGSAVLIRALQPTAGLAAMRARRNVTAPKLLCSGPGRLCHALAITGALDGAALDAPPFSLTLPTITAAVHTGRRIGLTRGVETPWRFVLSGTSYLSRPLREP